MLVYLDSSAILKRVLTEDHSVTFRMWVDRQANSAELITSTLSWVEVTRALRRHYSEHGLDAVLEKDVEALSGIAACPVSYEVISLARRIGPDGLRGLYAIHCATATLLDVDLFVSYDDRLLAAARGTALPVVAPGREVAK